MTEAWVLVDASSPWGGPSWVYDCGEYLGPGDFDYPPLVPADQNEVDFVLGFPNPDGLVEDFNDGSYTTEDYGKLRQDPPLLFHHYGGSYPGTGGRHLFIQAYPLGYPDDPTGLEPPTVLPLDLVPVGYTAGARYVAPVPGAMPFGGLDLTIDTTPTSVTGSVTFTFGTLSLTATAGGPAVALYDTDGVTWLANLPNTNGLVWQEEVSQPGSVTSNVPADDPNIALVTPRRFLKTAWRGGIRQAAQIGPVNTEAAVDGRQWLQFNQLPGALNLLSEAAVYPEYGLHRSSSGSRTFGYPSLPGTWRSSGNYTVPVAIRWSDMTGVRAGLPEGLDYPNPCWIAKRSPHFFEPMGATQYFYRDFTTYAENIPFQILATADNYLTLWLDGEQIFTPDMQQGLTWRFLGQITGNLAAGPHTLAAKVVNGGKTAAGSPLAFILTLQQTQDNGDVVPGTPLINTDTSWRVSDIAPGFKRAQVLQLLLSEARGRGVDALDILSTGFTFDNDSTGVPWADAPSEFTLDVGSSLLDAVQQLTETGMDVSVDPASMQVLAFNRQGQDRSSTVTLDLGANGGAILSHQIATSAPKFNTALMQLADGTWVEQQHPGSLASYGRMEVGLSMGSTSDAASAGRVADAQFAQSAVPVSAFTTDVSSLAGPQPYRDWFKGDSFNVPNGAGYQKVRTMAITVDASGEVPKVTPELIVDPS